MELADPPALRASSGRVCCSSKLKELRLFLVKIKARGEVIKNTLLP